MNSPIVTVNQGTLRGSFRNNIDGKKFFAFLGIPYAEPPVNKLRFKAPVPVEPWTGIKDATKEGDICYSRYEMTQALEGSENCLTLNVYTKELPRSKKNLKPVMVWIHGGGFIIGSSKPGLYGPEFLMTEDIVLVTINYRLGVLGFLSLEDSHLDVPGNAGLKDQTLALKWVQQNINNFNGDPSNVTIFGESAGSASVHYQILSSTSKGLFHKAILQSGSALNYWAYGKRVAKDLVKNLGHDVSNERDALEILMNTPVEKLHEAQEKLVDELARGRRRPVGPVIEYPNETAFITKNVIDIITSGDYNKVPMIVGYTTREGMLMDILKAQAELLSPGEIKKEMINLEDNIPWQVKLEEGSDVSKRICEKIKEVYFKSENQEDNQRILSSDSMFVGGIMAAVRNHMKTSKYPIFLYRMSVESGLNFLKNLFKLNHLPGVSHADDLGYLFKSDLTPEIKPGSLEDISLRRFVKLWTNFAKYGNPTPNEEELGIIWEPVKEGHTYYIDIGNELTLGINPETERLALWREIYQLNPETAEFL